MRTHRWQDVKRRAELLRRPRHVFTIERDGGTWMLRAVDLEGVFTQAESLDEAWEMAESVTALMLDIPRDSFTVALIRDRGSD